MQKLVQNAAALLSEHLPAMLYAPAIATGDKAVEGQVLYLVTSSKVL